MFFDDPEQTSFTQHVHENARDSCLKTQTRMLKALKAARKHLETFSMVLKLQLRWIEIKKIIKVKMKQ